jgi:hypothetical protein
MPATRYKDFADHTRIALNVGLRKNQRAIIRIFQREHPPAAGPIDFQHETGY